MKVVIKTKNKFFKNLNGSLLDVVDQTKSYVKVIVPAEDMSLGWGDTLTRFYNKEVVRIYEPGEMNSLSYPKLIMN